MKQKLIQARALVLKGWCQGCLARDFYGQTVTCMSDDAVSFCAAGAIIRVADLSTGEESRLLEYLRRGANLLYAVPLGDWNDRSTKEQVLAAFDRAIADV